MNLTGGPNRGAHPQETRQEAGIRVWGRMYPERSRGKWDGAWGGQAEGAPEGLFWCLKEHQEPSEMENLWGVGRTV